jgi:hypothetical protein
MFLVSNVCKAIVTSKKSDLREMYKLSERGDEWSATYPMAAVTVAIE